MNHPAFMKQRGRITSLASCKEGPKQACSEKMLDISSDNSLLQNHYNVFSRPEVLDVEPKHYNFESLDMLDSKQSDLTLDDRRD